jgi:Flp pilus assembly protein TadG
MATEGRRRDESGAIAVLVAFSATLLFVLAALVVDLGLARDDHRASQNAADASALAATNVLYPSSNVCTLFNPTGT